MKVKFNTELKIKNKFLWVFLSGVFFSKPIVGHTQTTAAIYEEAYISLKNMLDGKTPLDFKKAVFLTENAYKGNGLSEKVFNDDIEFLVRMAKAKAAGRALLDYGQADSADIQRQGAVFSVMADTTHVSSGAETALFLPFRYDFEDEYCRRDWSGMFVSKLMETHNGNCHSMTFLYKILCAELSVPCFLALAPRHIYIKQPSKKTGWYNTELTSGTFPIDGWLMASLHIPLEAVQNGAYMKPLSDEESVAICAVDLAKGYEIQFPEQDESFILKCCDLALAHHPVFINALLLKAASKKRQFDRLARRDPALSVDDLKKTEAGQALWGEMTALYRRIYGLGYRQEKTSESGFSRF